MKLLYCARCNSLFNLDFNLKECTCGAARGKYEPDGVHATYTEGIPLAIDNNGFDQALKRIKSNEGQEPVYFDACIVPKYNKTFLWRKGSEIESVKNRNGI